MYDYNQKCSWHIKVNNNAYIRLTFEDFDVFEEVSDVCLRDFVEVTDSDRGGTSTRLIGRYCNTFLPPAHLSSAWNQMVIDFLTDGQQNANGFQARYEALYDVSPGGLTSNNTSEGRTSCRH